MQAIVSKYISATNTKGARIKAVCERGSITIPYPHELSGEEAHHYAVAQLVARLVAEDLEKRGEPIKGNPFSRPLICGQLPSWDYVHVFLTPDWIPRAAAVTRDLLAELETMTHSVPMKGENGITWYAIPDQRMASARAVVLRAKGGAS